MAVVSMERVARAKVQFVQGPWKSFARYRDNFPSTSSIVSRLRSSPVLGDEFRPTRRDRAPSSTFTILSLSLSEFDACFANSWVRSSAKISRNRGKPRLSSLCIKVSPFAPRNCLWLLMAKWGWSGKCFSIFSFSAERIIVTSRLESFVGKRFVEYRWKYRNSN